MNRYELLAASRIELYYYDAETPFDAAMQHFLAFEGKLDGPWIVTDMDTYEQTQVNQVDVIAQRYYDNNCGEPEETWVLSE